VTTASPDGTVTTVAADGTTTTVSPNGTTTTVLADGTTTTTAADGTVVASNDSSKSGAECPPGMTASKTESGAPGACAATTTSEGTSQERQAPRVAARPSAAPVTQGLPAPVFATRDLGVNLFPAGRRNGPGTPDPDMRK
jgi:hypothetical protein